MEATNNIRLNRILGRDGRTLIVALDHGISGISPLSNLGRPAELIQLVIMGGADAILTTPGIANSFASSFGKVGLILRIDGGPSALTGKWEEMQVFLSVENALKLGADAVIMMGISGGEGESKSLVTLGKVATECRTWGIPLIAEMLPGGFGAGEVSMAHIITSARLGAEYGANIVKIKYQGPVDEYQKVIESCYCPIVVLGGSKKEPKVLIEEIKGAMNIGAIGAAIGRNIWQSEDPQATTRAIYEAVHQQ